MKRYHIEGDFYVDHAGYVFPVGWDKKTRTHMPVKTFLEEFGSEVNEYVFGDIKISYTGGVDGDVCIESGIPADDDTGISFGEYRVPDKHRESVLWFLKIISGESVKFGG